MVFRINLPHQVQASRPLEAGSFQNVEFLFYLLLLRELPVQVQYLYLQSYDDNRPLNLHLLCRSNQKSHDVQNYLTYDQKNRFLYQYHTFHCHLNSAQQQSLSHWYFSQHALFFLASLLLLFKTNSNRICMRCQSFRFCKCFYIIMNRFQSIF